MEYLRAGALLGVGLVFTSIVVNCGDRDVSRFTGALSETSDAGETALIDHCVPGQTFACMGGCGAPSTGYQVCAPDGRSYGPCVCPPLRTLGPIPSLSDRDDGGRTIVSQEGQFGGLPISSGPGAPGEGVVGAKCRKDADCISGLGCLTAAGGDLDFRGPAGGYCSSRCGNDAACQAIDPGSECVGFAGQNICVRSCASRTTPSGVSKCLDRTDVTCVSVAALGDEPPGNGPQRGLCLPSCQSDAQCGPGLFCNLGDGLCANEPRAGDPVGSVCEGAESCASGLCLTLNDRFEKFCSGFCRFGGPGCGFDGSEASPGAGCALGQVPNEGVGDRGLCLELCQDASDCHEAGAECLLTAAGSATRVCVVRKPAPPVTSVPDAGTPDPSPSDPPEPPASTHTGDACNASAECGAGLTCLRAEEDSVAGAGGPAGGYCSATCVSSPCPEPGAVCVRLGDDSAICLRRCDPSAGAECGGRDTLVCDTFPEGDPTLGFCRPQCNSNADCEPRVCSPNGLCVDPTPECTEDSQCPGGVCDPQLGQCVAAPACPEGTQCEEPPPECTTDEQCGVRRCDTASGSCVDASCALDRDCRAGVCNVTTRLCIPAPAIPVGGSCTRGADCAGGRCGSFDGISGFCSADCTLNTNVGCEVYGSNATCLLPAGTNGRCAELCDSAADCAQPGYQCFSLGAGTVFNDRSGFCRPPLAATPPAAPPPALPAAPPPAP